MGLPIGFKRLDYIQSTGTQYIDTGFKPNQNTRVEMSFEHRIRTTDEFLFGARTALQSTDFSFAWIGTSYYRTYYNNLVSNYGTGVKYDVKVPLDKNKNVTNFNGSTITQTAGTFQAPCNLYLFAVNTNGVAELFSSTKLYYCRIYDNGTLIRNFIPVITDTGKVGLFDLAEEVFYENKGTGIFGCGHVFGENIVLVYNPLSVTVNEDMNLLANFTLATRTMSADVYPAGSGSVDGVGNYIDGDLVTLKPLPLKDSEGTPKYRFDKWVDNGLTWNLTAPTGTLATQSISFTDDENNRYDTISYDGVSFIYKNTVTLDNVTVYTGGAWVDPKYQKINLQTVPSLTLVNFLNASGTRVIPGAAGTDDPLVYTANKDRYLTANFVEICEIKTKTSRGTGSVTGAGFYDVGETVTLTAVPEVGYTFAKWLDESGVVVGTAPTFTFTAPAGGATYTAQFGIEWGHIEGEIKNQIDLKKELDSKINELTAVDPVKLTETITLDSEGLDVNSIKVEVKYDDTTIKLNSEGALFAVKPQAGVAIDVSTTGVIDARFDDDTIKVNSDNKLYAVKPQGGKAIDVSTTGVIDAKYDDVTIKLNSEGEMYAVKPQSGQAINVSSTGVIDALTDGTTIVISGNKLKTVDVDVPILKASGRTLDDVIRSADWTNSENYLIDEVTVNEKIASNSATYRGAYDNLAALNAAYPPGTSGYAATIANNDYAYIAEKDSEGFNYIAKYKAICTNDGAIPPKFTLIKWDFEYRFKVSAFTSKENAALQSGATKAIIDNAVIDHINKLDEPMANALYKVLQSVVLDPTASGEALQFIDSISQDSEGVITVTKKDISLATQLIKGLMSAADKEKLDSVSYDADKVTKSLINGNIKINDSESIVYTLPVATATELGGIKAAPAGANEILEIKIGADNKLYTVPSGKSYAFSVVPHSTKIRVVETDAYGVITTIDLQLPYTAGDNVSITSEGVISAEGKIKDVIVDGLSVVDPTTGKAQITMSHLAARTELDAVKALLLNLIDSESNRAIAKENVIETDLTLTKAKVAIIESELPTLAKKAYVDSEDNAIRVWADDSFIKKGTKVGKVQDVLIDGISAVDSEGKADIPLAPLATKVAVEDGLAKKQDKLTAGHNIEITSEGTINALASAKFVFDKDTNILYITTN